MSIYLELEQIFRAGVERVNPYQMLKQHARLDDGRLRFSFEGNEGEIDLRGKKIFVLGAGKAAAPMAKAIEEILGEGLEGGIVSTKYGHAEPLKKVQVVEAGHPVPDENSLRAGEAMRALAGRFNGETHVINLISGGGSALLELLPEQRAPGQNAPPGLDDLQRTTQVLLESGATINEMNCIRKHLSAIKGGQLIRLIQPAQSANFILSDVVGDRLDAIASGLTVGDPTTFGEAMAILEKYGIQAKVPAPVRKVLEAGALGRIPETPKPGDTIFATTQNILVGTNAAALQAAAAEARRNGYQTTILTSELVGEAREVAKMLLGAARELRGRAMLGAPPACLIAGGETTVTVTGNGTGGRNQEMALSFLNEMGKDPAIGEGIYFLSAATDGGDGPTDAAGAYASLELWRTAVEKDLSPGAFLINNDAYHFFEKVGGLLKTGPTKTNVCDIQICIIR